jgi:hypothetical protein
MAMTEAFATTAATVLPVVSFAMVVSLQGITGTYKSWRPEQFTRAEFISRNFVVPLYLIVLVSQVTAEWLCLSFLADTPVLKPAWARYQDGVITLVIIVSMFVLLVLPALFTFSGWYIRLYRWMFSQIRAKPPAPAEQTALVEKDMH